MRYLFFSLIFLPFVYLFSGGTLYSASIARAAFRMVRWLRARGDLEVDLTWKDGKLTAAALRAMQDGSFRIFVDGQLSALITFKQGETYRSQL